MQLKGILEMPCVKDFSSSALLLYTFCLFLQSEGSTEDIFFDKCQHATNTYFEPRTFLRSCLYVVEVTSELRMIQTRHTAVFLPPNLPLLLPAGFLPPSLADPISDVRSGSLERSRRADSRNLKGSSSEITLG